MDQSYSAPYSVQNGNVDRVVVHANDTDIIIMCLYSAPTHLRCLPELNTYLPVHQMVSALGLGQYCCPAVYP